MSSVQIATYLFWIGPVLMEAALVTAMTWRKMFREMPLFFTYVCFDLVHGAALFAIYHKLSYVIYFIVFWIDQGILMILGLLVIWEVLSYAFKAYDALQQLSTLIFRWLTIILVLVAVLTAAAAPGADADRMLAGLFVVVRSVRLVQVGLLFFLFLFSHYFGVSWRHYAFGVGLGFGLYGSVELAALAVRTQLGVISANTLNLVSGAAQTCALFIWCAYLLRPQRHKSIEVLPKANLEQWNQALLELLHR